MYKMCIRDSRYTGLKILDVLVYHRQNDLRGFTAAGRAKNEHVQEPVFIWEYLPRILGAGLDQIFVLTQDDVARLVGGIFTLAHFGTHLSQLDPHTLAHIAVSYTHLQPLGPVLQLPAELCKGQGYEVLVVLASYIGALLPIAPDTANIFVSLVVAV